MLSKTHKGTSNEDLTSGILTRLGFALPVRRQSDYGIDFLCCVGKEFGESTYPTETFTVQLKSNFNDIVVDISNKDKYKWLIENTIPFFNCVYNQKDGFLYFYSLSMFHDYIIRNYKNINKIKFQFEEPNDSESIININNKLSNKNKTYIINCGQPFLKINVTHDTETFKDEFKIYKNILEKIIIKEKQNLVFRQLKLPFMSWLHKFSTNNENILFGWADYSSENLISSSDLLKVNGQIIMTLAKTYENENFVKEYESLKNIINLIPFEGANKSTLINLGFRDLDGTTK